jgi:NADH-quinone oxidoreductase subunit E
MKITSYRPGEAGDFAFTPEAKKRADAIIARYPAGRESSATIALLDLAQRQVGGWLGDEAIEYVANYLGVAPIRVHEVASFYSMFNRKPVGKYFIQVCRTTPCWLRGSDEITRACFEAAGVDDFRQESEDGLFSVIEVECLGACANAPMVQINDHYYEDLTPERMTEIIVELRAGKDVPKGSQSGRMASAPAGGPTTLTDLPNRDPRSAGKGDAKGEGA